MSALKTPALFLASLSALVTVIILMTGCQSRYENLDLSMYQYRDTKNLVKFVYDAASILEKEGMKGLDYFRRNRTMFITEDYYLYIYDTDGINMFHAGMEHLEGKNLADITDKDGKKTLSDGLTGPERSSQSSCLGTLFLVGTGEILSCSQIILSFQGHNP